MRLTARTITDTEASRISTICGELGLNDVALMFDVYSVFVDPGCMLDYWSAEGSNPGVSPDDLAARYSVLFRLVTLSLFRDSIGVVDPYEFVRRIASLLALVLPRVRRDCPFGEPYMDKSSSMTAEMNAEGRKGVSLEAEAFDTLITTQNLLENKLVMSAAQSYRSSIGKMVSVLQNKHKGDHDATYTGSLMAEEVHRELFTTLLMVSPLMLEVYSNVLESVGGHKEGFGEHNPLAHTFRLGFGMSDDIHDLPDATMDFLCKEPSEQDKAIATGQIDIHTRMATPEKRPVFGLALDVSTSMSTFTALGMGSPIRGMYNVGRIRLSDFAVPLVLVLLQKMWEKQGILVLTCFSGKRNTDTIICRTEDDYLRGAQMVGLGDFNGSHTYIESGIHGVSQGLAQVEEETGEKASGILMVSDGIDDDLTVHGVRHLFAEFNLDPIVYFLCCAPKNTGSAGEAVFKRFGPVHFLLDSPPSSWYKFTQTIARSIE